MQHDAESARAKAEAMFKTPAPQVAGSAADRAEQAVHEKTERLRAARLAQEALKQKGAEIRRERLRGA